MTDLELTYLLSTYGEQVYGLALARAQSENLATHALQQVFLDQVLFPSALEGSALQTALLKKAAAYTRGSKIKEAPPQTIPPEIESELLVLMKEARDHQGILPPPKKRWRKGHTIAAAALGFLLIAILLPILLFGHGGQTISDEGGNNALLNPAPQQQAPAKPQEPSLPPPNEDPLYPFEKIETETCTTFTSLSDFLESIENRTALGYGEHYYTDRALLILPNRLPDDARFRCLYLDSKSGNYSYSFQFEYKKTLYLLDFKVTQSLPASALEMPEAIKDLQEEKTGRTINGALLSASFGKDRVQITLRTPESESPIEDDLAAKLLNQVTLERCSPENPFLQN